MIFGARLTLNQPRLFYFDIKTSLYCVDSNTRWDTSFVRKKSKLMTQMLDSSKSRH